jgi:hypothetical protein
VTAAATVTRALAIAAAAAALAGCDDYLPDVGPPLTGGCQGDDSNPEVDVSFARDLRPLFDRPRSMAGCGCHTPTNGSPSGIELSGFNMGSLQAIRQGGVTSGAAIIKPGDPCGSVLVQKMGDTPPFGARMPLDGAPFFSDEELQLLHDWIAEGARDN